MSLDKSHLYVVILCGGGGTRLWPLSRNKSPKQFIELVGQETLFEKTLARALDIVPLDHVYIMTNKEYLSEITRLAKDIDQSHIIAEPEKKNTALAMGVISGIIHEADNEAVVINLASDHLIVDLPVFKETVMNAAEVASQGNYLVTVGILPSFPHTGFGYIHRAGKLMDIGSSTVYSVAGFREKPSLDIATSYLASGEYYWNANLYTWSTKLILGEFKNHAPELYSHIDKIMQASHNSDFSAVMSECYRNAEEAQIDTAISEKTDKLVVIPGNFGWSDVGSWNVVHDEVPHDELGNALIARDSKSLFIPLDTQNSLVSVGAKAVATIGVKNLMIIDTDDALLVANKDQAQDVKAIIAELTKRKREDLL